MTARSGTERRGRGARDLFQHLVDEWFGAVAGLLALRRRTRSGTPLRLPGPGSSGCHPRVAGRGRPDHSGEGRSGVAPDSRAPRRGHATDAPRPPTTRPRGRTEGPAARAAGPSPCGRSVTVAALRLPGAGVEQQGAAARAGAVLEVEQVGQAARLRVEGGVADPAGVPVV